MALTCPKCRRANPAEATYCYFDGNVLANGHAVSGPINPATVAFPMPFVFPSGQSCHNFDQLALACLNNWATARDMVREGMLRGFFGGLGRADLALAADEAARYPDRDRGLAQLLGKLPTQAVPTPKLIVTPAQISLGVIPVGQDRGLELRLGNAGLGLLYGSIQCDDDNLWLALLNVPVGTNRKLFQFVDEAVIPILVRGQNLRAGTKPLEATLTVESNGGTQTVVVTADVPVKPFPAGVLGGAKTPRQVAEKAKAAPREAAALFENGAVGQWYKDNGWTYPVQGPPASGLGAVQQFFEALGLTPPPKVQLSVASLSLYGSAGASLRTALEVSTQEKRPIYAHANSDQAWLKVERVQVKGRTVVLPLSVPVVPHCPGETLRARLTVTSNGNQRFEVPVSLAVAGSGVAAAKVPVLDMMEVLSAPGPTAARASWGAADAAVPVLAAANPFDNLEEAVPVPPRRTKTAPATLPPPPTARPVPGGSRLLALVPVALLMLGLLVTGTHDLVAWAFAPKDGDAGAVEKEPPLDPNPRIELAFVDKNEDVELDFGGAKPAGEVGGDRTKAVVEPTMQFGLVKLDPSATSAAEPMRLTFTPSGTTNSTCLKVDNEPLLFGQKRFLINGKPEGTGGWKGKWMGHWRDLKKPLGKDATGRERIGSESVWAIDEKGVAVTQTVEVIPGPQGNLLDTCLVQYRIKNEDTKVHSVGLRFLLDTYIGANDGVPFLLPGGKSELCDTMKDFNMPDEIPPYIQACENEDPANPGTIALIRLKLGGMDPPSRVTLGGYPAFDLGNSPSPLARPRVPGCYQEKTGWAVPVFPMKTKTPADSAVVIYWDPKDVKPGETRTVGFTYGLGYVSGGEGKGKLALTKDGSFAPKGEFTVTALVKSPTPGQTVTLTLPAGFSFISGSGTQPVPPVPPGVSSSISPVTWKVQCSSKSGKYTLKAQTSTGESVTDDVRIKKGLEIFGN